MTDFAGHNPIPTHISNFSRWGAVWDLRGYFGGINPASGAYSAANRAMYFPLILPWPFTVRRLFWGNGSAAGGNWDIGLYNPAGTRLVSSGSTVGAGASTIQFVTPAALPLLLSAGRYYLALVHDAVTANHIWGLSVTSAFRARQAGIVEEAAALPLPASMTPATATNVVIPLCGVTSRTT